MLLAEIVITGWNVLGWGIAIFATAMIFSKVWWRMVDKM